MSNYLVEVKPAKKKMGGGVYIWAKQVKFGSKISFFIIF